MSVAEQFRMRFIKAYLGERPALVSAFCAANPSVVNLFGSLDYNYQVKKNPLEEIAARKRADNIHFICDQLRAYPNLVMPK